MPQQFDRPNRRPGSNDPYDEAGNTYSDPLNGMNGDGIEGQNEDSVDSIKQPGSSAMSGSELKGAEESGSNKKDTPSGGESNEQDSLNNIGYRDEGQTVGGKVRQKLKGSLSTNKGKLIGGGIFGGGIAGLLIGGMFLLPLKVLHIANNLQDQFFASSEQATEDMTDRLLRSYIVKRVIPGMNGRCTSTLQNRNCVAVSPGDGLIANLYNGWKDAKLEQKMATKHGIVIERKGNSYRMITPSTLESNGISLGDYNGGSTDGIDRNLSQAMSRGEVRREFRAAMERETFSKRMMYRYKYGRLIERKYGIARCLLACNTRDKFSDNKDAKKAAFKSHFIRRVVIPRSELIGTAMLCVVQGATCTTAPEEPNEHGERRTQLEIEATGILIRERDKYSQQDIDQIHKDTEDFRKKGVAQTLLARALNEKVASLTTKGLPVIGWLDLGSRLVSGLQDFGPTIRQVNYVINSAAMVTTYSMLRSTADEMKTGEIDSFTHGSTITGLSETDGNERTDQGGISAEGSPLYGELIGSKGVSTGFLPSSNKVYAEGKGYTCDNGALPKDELVCPEETLVNSRGVTKAGDGITLAFENSPLLGGLGVTADLWLKTGGKLFDAAGEILGDAIGGFFKLITPKDVENKVADLKAKLSEAMADFFTNYFINNPVSDDPSGARMFNLAAGGADVAGNDFAHYGLGGKRITDQEAAALRQERAQEKLESFKSQSLFARVFDTSSEHSIVSKMAISMPGDSVMSISRSAVGSLINPAKFFSFFSPASSSVSAASLEKDPFGVTQYAWDKNDTVFTDDPEAHWAAEDCDNPEKVKEWGKKSVLNEETGMQEHDISEDCVLMVSAIGSAGGLFTDKVLTDEDLGISDTSSGTIVAGDLSSEGFQWPVSKSDYKPLNNCFRKPGHTGIDIPITNRPVLAAKAGKVIQAGPAGDAGNAIVIEHGGGRWTNYQHLSSIKVNKGATVATGEVIGTSGNTGYSTGPHLHFSVTNKAGIDSRRSVAFSLNPLSFLPKDRSLGACG